MPMHDWTRVAAGIYHAFHHEWISELSRVLNRELLPPDYYALPEQVAAGFGPDVLALQTGTGDSAEPFAAGVAGTKLQSRPQTRYTAETEVEFYRRKKSSVVVRHASGDRIAAMLEIVSPGNKSSRYALRSFVDKACELLERRIHLLIIDPFPPGPRDPEGIHAAIWSEVEGVAFTPDADRPLTSVAYECDVVTRAHVETFAVGQALPDMPLFLEPDGCVMVPLESTYLAAFEALPKRWQAVLSPQS
jgi:Protein of unknown function (DUF4058)